MRGRPQSRWARRPGPKTMVSADEITWEHCEHICFGCSTAALSARLDGSLHPAPSPLTGRSLLIALSRHWSPWPVAFYKEVYSGRSPGQVRTLRLCTTQMVPKPPSRRVVDVQDILTSICTKWAY